MTRAQVLDYNLQQQLKEEMSQMKPRPGIYDPDFIAANQVYYISSIIYVYCRKNNNNLILIRKNVHLSLLITRH